MRVSRARLSYPARRLTGLFGPGDRLRVVRAGCTRRSNFGEVGHLHADLHSGWPGAGPAGDEDRGLIRHQCCASLPATSDSSSTPEFAALQGSPRAAATPAVACDPRCWGSAALKLPKCAEGLSAFGFAGLTPRWRWCWGCQPHQASPLALAPVDRRLQLNTGRHRRSRRNGTSQPGDLVPAAPCHRSACNALAPWGS